MIKNRKYWLERLETSPAHEVIAEISEAISQGESSNVAYGLLAIVEAMGKNDEHKLTSKLRGLCEHLYLLKILSPEDPRYKENISHWTVEIRNYRKDIAVSLMKEPHRKRLVPSIIEDVLPDAKAASYEYLQLEGDDWINLVDLQEEEILTTNILQLLNKKQARSKA